MSLRLKAIVKEATGRTAQYIGHIVAGTPEVMSQLPVPAWIEISEEDGAFYLYHFNAAGVCFADTWHESLDDAKRQAQHEFGISAGEWVTL